MAYSFKGSITFGLVYIPVTLHNTVKSGDISFNQLDKKTLSRVVYKKTCVDCEGRELAAGDIVRGYQYEKGKYVVVEDGDLEKIKSKKDKTVYIEAFVGLSEIDPLYYDRTYYVAPEGGAERAFVLLRAALEKENKVGIAKTMLGGRECLAAVREKDGHMLLSTMYFASEIQADPAAALKAGAGEKELKMAESIIAGMTEKDFDLSAYRDEYRARLNEAIDKKIRGQAVNAPKDAPEFKVSSLMDALAKSLEKVKKERAESGGTGKRVRG